MALKGAKHNENESSLAESDSKGDDGRNGSGRESKTSSVTPDTGSPVVRKIGNKSDQPKQEGLSVKTIGVKELNKKPEFAVVADAITQEVIEVKAHVIEQIAAEMEKQKISKRKMAVLLDTSRTQVDRILDANSGSSALDNLVRVARVLGRTLHCDLM